MSEQVHKTVFYDKHVALGAKMVEFGGWLMPIQYNEGIVHEHLATRKEAGLFDTSHMGRFIIQGKDALPFMQHVLSNNAAALDLGESQYTIIPNEQGGAIDDGYLYRFVDNEYLLVINAANREKDWAYLLEKSRSFADVQLTDRTSEIAMLSLQGPMARDILLNLIDSGHLPDPVRNALSIVSIKGSQVKVARTGYTGEPICFELFVNRDEALMIWDLLLEHKANPVGLGARDTLRLEANLPLYGHELNEDMPVFSCPLAKFAVSFSSLKGDFVGREPLLKQFNAMKLIMDKDYSLINDLPRIIQPVAIKGKGLAREGAKVFCQGKEVGYVTSGTMVPLWKQEGEGIASQLTDEKGMRAIALAQLNSDIEEGTELEVEIRKKKVPCVVVPYHLRNEAPPYARPIYHDEVHKHREAEPVEPALDVKDKVSLLLDKAVANTIWRQKECINLIPSEMSMSSMTRLLSITDPVGRYAEHKQVAAFSDAEVFYYQGTEFIGEVEKLLQKEMRKYLGCSDVEARVISGQMANTCVFSSMVDYLNRADRKSEPRRMRKIMNHHIIKGGHLSAQPMGALKDFVARDPQTERPAVVNFPALKENPYAIDVPACRELFEEHKPELIILGKSMILHKEPVADMRAMVDEICPDCVIMFDMAHVLGLVGPAYQEPFKEGADIVTGSTHKTFFGTQRGIIGANLTAKDPNSPLWDAIERRSFPGSVSNHHLGTLLGLLMATYEMNTFKHEYQQKVVNNAKAFAKALKDTGLDVAGDPDISYTETHQVILNVGYAHGPEIAQRLEENNIVCNYQATAEEEGFTASGSLRLGVSEMTRFGMQEEDFQQLAQIMYDCIVKQKPVQEEVKAFRQRFLDLKYCFNEQEFAPLMQKLHNLV